MTVEQVADVHTRDDVYTSSEVLVDYDSFAELGGLPVEATVYLDDNRNGKRAVAWARVYVAKSPGGNARILWELCDSLSGNLEMLATRICGSEYALDELEGFNLLLVEVTALDPRFAGTEQGTDFETQALALAIHGTGQADTADVLAHPEHADAAVLTALGFEDWRGVKLARGYHQDVYETIGAATGIWGLCT